MNIDATRVGTDGGTKGAGPGPRGLVFDQRPTMETGGLNGVAGKPVPGLGRWPANVVLDDHAAAELDGQSGTLKSGKQLPTHKRSSQRMGASGIFGASAAPEDDPLTETYGDSGGASRFFPTFRYQAKAPTRERVSYVKEGDGDEFQATSYGQMRKRRCNVCGSRSNPAGGDHSGKPWPACGHDDWAWVEQKKAGAILRLRDDLTDDQRAYVLAELTRAGVDVA